MIFLFLNGRLFDDCDGNFTCTTYNGRSVVDYHIASSELFTHVSYFNVVFRVDSDHFPLQCRITVRQRKITLENIREVKPELFPLEKFK